MKSEDDWIQLNEETKKERPIRRKEIEIENAQEEEAEEKSIVIFGLTKDVERVKTEIQ